MPCPAGFMYSTATARRSVRRGTAGRAGRACRGLAAVLKTRLKSHAHPDAVQQNMGPVRPYPKPLIMLTCLTPQAAAPVPARCLPAWRAGVF